MDFYNHHKKIKINGAEYKILGNYRYGAIVKNPMDEKWFGVIDNLQIYKNGDHIGSYRNGEFIPTHIKKNWSRREFENIYGLDSRTHNKQYREWKLWKAENAEKPA